MSDRLAEAEGIADGKHHLAYLRLRRIAELERREGAIAFDLEHGDIEQSVLADQARGVGFSAVQRHLNLLLASDDMVVGDHMAFFGDDDPGTLPLGGIAPHAGAPREVEQALGADAGDVDAHHGWHHGAGEAGVFVVKAREQFDIAEVERRAVRQGEFFRPEAPAVF